MVKSTTKYVYCVGMPWVRAGTTKIYERLASCDVEAYIFTSRKRSLRRLFLQVSVCPRGGVRGCSWGGGHAWLLWGGACMVAPGGHLGGVCGCSGGGHVWDTTRYGDTVNERAVRILLECILVLTCYCKRLR